MAPADDITDLTIAPKFRLWQGPDDKLKFSARLDLKLPTASKRNGLGTGDPDVGLVGIATYKLGKTSFDSNFGYYAIDFSRTDFDNDRWFIGEAVRHEVNEKWTIAAEAYGLLPNKGAGGHATWYFSAGPQWCVRDNILVTALIGSARLCSVLLAADPVAEPQGSNNFADSDGSAVPRML